MQFVFLAFQMAEEAAHSREPAFAINDQLLLFRTQIDPRNVCRNVCLSREAFQLREKRTVLRLRPGLNCTFVQSFRLIRNYEIKVEVDGVSKTLAARTRAVRIVE